MSNKSHRKSVQLSFSVVFDGFKVEFSKERPVFDESDPLRRSLGSHESHAKKRTKRG